jgi:hypothetical protein
MCNSVALPLHIRLDNDQTIVLYQYAARIQATVTIVVDYRQLLVTIIAQLTMIDTVRLLVCVRF